LLFQDGYIFHYLDSGEWEMTFQVALRGSDGIILASDKQTAFNDVLRLAREPRTMRWLSMGSKVQVSKLHNVVIGMAGSELSAMAADFLLEKLDSGTSLDGEMTSVMRNAANDAARQFFGPLDESKPLSENRAGSTLLVIAPDNPACQIFRVDVSQRSFVHPIDAKAFAGDCANPAMFFVERYYDELNLRPIMDLRLIAAHTIFMGAKLTNLIKGLEMLVCRKGQRPESLPDRDIESLAEQARQVDEKLKQSLFYE